MEVEQLLKKKKKKDDGSLTSIKIQEYKMVNILEFEDKEGEEKEQVDLSLSLSMPFQPTEPHSELHLDCSGTSKRRSFPDRYPDSEACKSPHAGLRLLGVSGCPAYVASKVGGL